MKLRRRYDRRVIKYFFMTTVKQDANLCNLSNTLKKSSSRWQASAEIQTTHLYKSTASPLTPTPSVLTPPRCLAPCKQFRGSQWVTDQYHWIHCPRTRVSSTALLEKKQFGPRANRNLFQSTDETSSSQSSTQPDLPPLRWSGWREAVPTPGRWPARNGKEMRGREWPMTGGGGGKGKYHISTGKKYQK